MHDLVIRGGTLIDGTGSEAVTADVAVDGEQITAVGRVGRGRREIDADGLLVTPGFVDIHTHYDAQVTWDPILTPSVGHGVTTVMMGNCGVGFAPVAPDRHDWLIGLMEGVEDIPGAALHEGIRWGWETFPEYMDAIDGLARTMDYAVQIPHGALRAYVMGDRGAANEDANADDIDAMYRQVKAALSAGALGFSTSRTLLHKAVSGRPVPGTFAARDELFGIGRALKESGHGVFQLATEHANVPEELDWMVSLAEWMKRPVMFNLSQIYDDPNLWRRGLAGLEDAAARGVPVYAQVAGRAIGVVMSWHLTANPFSLKLPYLQIMHHPVEEKMALLRDPAFRAKVIAEPAYPVGEFETFVTRSFDKMYPLTSGTDYEPNASESLAAIAAREGRSPDEVAYDLLMAHNGEGMIYFPLFNYADGDLEILRELHLHPSTRMGLSDAGAHCGAICDGGMPTFMLTHWTRDRARGERIPLPHIIRRQTQETARTVGLYDRGVVAPGMLADLNVIDYDALAIGRPEVVRDLPAGGRRVIQRATGYHTTVKRGRVTVMKDQVTEERPGGLIRGPQGAPSAGSRT